MFPGAEFYLRGREGSGGARDGGAFPGSELSSLCPRDGGGGTGWALGEVTGAWAPQQGVPTCPPQSGMHLQDQIRLAAGLLEPPHGDRWALHGPPHLEFGNCCPSPAGWWLPWVSSPLGPGPGCPGAVPARAPQEGHPAGLPRARLPAQCGRGPGLAGGGGGACQTQDPAVLQGQLGPGVASQMGLCPAGAVPTRAP